ncbi:MAG: HAD family hydrolase [Cypionkella sp.]|uniref:HAD family hydrolase n=1 Tax=Cypionkella sp. TaxID=2811411 RepID=UPI002ABBC4FB|nr:HAD family hydrolase [Cypionkella sp.]MDZ4311381.1 HAD family hydrolase [Cypionkella sp.]MDZ4395850.1 HAD family hydrolase [Cypionkella sp.]
MFDLVIFDCDGVLIDSEIISAQMLIDALAERGVQIDLAYVARHFLGRSYPTVMNTIREEFNLTLPPDFEEQYRARLLQRFEQELKIMPGVAEVIAQMGVPYCIATSSSPMRAAKSLDMVGLGHLAGERLFTSTLVARGKPAPDLFLYAAQKMAVEPGRCLVIEDSLTGIRAGLAAGMQVWRFTGGSHLKDRALDEPEDARPHNRFASFAAFYDIAPELKGQT